ncbi:MAG: hypothetical protein LBO69_04645, partial [Ignavibacteria bacterium]|nr:hypothetical protein [Ignavibacteria bacterium]
MNHFNSKVGYFFLIVAMLITFSACKDDSVSVGGGDGIFSTSLKTAFVGAKPSDEFITHFEQIFTQKQSAIDNNTKVVVIYNRLSMLSVSDKEAIKRVYDADGAIVCVNPHMRDLSEFRDYLGHEMGGVVVGHDNQFCEFYAFNRWGNCYTQAYFIPEEGVAYTTTEESEDASNPEYNKGGTGDFTLKNITWEAAEYKSAMKPFGEWLTECVVTNRTSKQKMRNQLTDGELSLGDLNTNISH